MLNYLFYLNFFVQITHQQWVTRNTRKALYRDACVGTCSDDNNENNYNDKTGAITTVQRQPKDFELVNLNINLAAEVKTLKEVSC